MEPSTGLVCAESPRWVRDLCLNCMFSHCKTIVFLNGKTSSLPEGYNGISLDLVNEQPGGVSSELYFGDHSLFKLESFHAPTLVAESVVSDPNFAIMTDLDYAELVRLHAVHEANNYELVVYEDERHDMLTFPNYKFGKQPDGLNFKMTTFATPALATPWWLQWSDHRIMFQVSDRLVSSRTAYDSIAFHHSSMQDPSKRPSTGTTGRNQTVYSEMPLRPFARVYPCRLKISNGQSYWQKMNRSEFEEETRVKQLATDRIDFQDSERKQTVQHHDGYVVRRL